MAKVLIAVGLFLVALGALWLVFPKALSWFGKLPGDINSVNGTTRIFIPIVSILFVSVGLTIIVNLIAWLLRLLK